MTRDRVSRLGMSKIDVCREVKRIVTVQRAGASRARRGEVVTVAGRRRGDEMVDDRSQEKAKALAWDSAGNGWDEV